MASSSHSSSPPRPASMPALLYGTAWKGPRTAPLVCAAIHAGFRGVDTAAQPRHYDERAVGQGLADAMRSLRLARHDVWIQTKFTPFDGQHASDPMVSQQGGLPYDPHVAPEVQVRQSVARSLLHLCSPLPGAGIHSLYPGHKGKARAQPAPPGLAAGGHSISTPVSEAAVKATSKQKAPSKAGTKAEAGAGAEAEAEAEAEAKAEIECEDPIASLPSDWYLDSLLLHSPLRTLPDTARAWSVMEDLVEAGRVRQIGLSNVHDPRIWTFLRGPSISPRVRPNVLQNRWHHSTGHDVAILPSLSPVISPNDYPFALTTQASPDPHTLNHDDLAPHAPDAQGVRYQPFWLLTGNPRLLESTSVLASAAERGMTPEQIVYRFAAQGFGLPGLKVTVLCGSTNPVHVAQAVDAVSGPPAHLEGNPLPGEGGLDGAKRLAHPDLDEDTLEAIRREVYGL